MAHAPGRTTALTIGHSPDPDDAFMWWPLGDAATGRAPSIDVGPFMFTAVPADIESLNRRAVERADLDITALSIHAYPAVRAHYALTACGGSFGDGYGPKVVCRPETLRGRSGASWLADPSVRTATPGVRTTAHLALRMCVGAAFRHVETPFERIIGAVVAGEVEAGVVIHEGQLTFGDAGLALAIDLGGWWKEQTGLPLPLGGNALRRDLAERLGADGPGRLAGVLRRSIDHALSRRAQGLDYAMGFARDISRERADRFISMYVNELTVDCGSRGERAIRTLLGRAAAAGLCEPPGDVDLVHPGPAEVGAGEVNA